MHLPVLFLAVAASSLGFAAAPPARSGAVKAELKKLQGRWLLQKVERDGRTTWDSRDQEREHILTIEGARWIEAHPDARTRMAAFDAEGKAFDVITTFRGHTFHGEAIYKIEGDILKLCHRKGKGNRPAGFDTSTDPNVVLRIYKRLKKE
jgi:uncharacterized protein (TIGR03067 family)